MTVRSSESKQIETLIPWLEIAAVGDASYQVDLALDYRVSSLVCVSDSDSEGSPAIKVNLFEGRCSQIKFVGLAL